jgi:tripartite-type tricarboxylate transporter receptor subunit TctC
MMKMLIATLAAAALLPSGASFAQAYPAKPVRYVVPFPAGDSPDIVGRLLSERLNRMWGQPVLVENRPGAGGTVGAAYVAKAPPDGYTLFQCNIASNAIAYSLYAKLPYHPLRDFAPISRIGTTASAVVVHPSMPAKSIAELIAYAKANPGKLSYGSPGSGTSPQLAMELFQIMAQVKLVHIAYKGAAPTIGDLLGGQIPLGMVNIPALLSPVGAGRLRALAVTGPKRAPQWPSVPTMAEAGMKGYNVTAWYALCAPAGTPRAIVDKVHADLVGVLQIPEIRQRFADLVVEPAPSSPDELGEFIAAETSRWAKVVKEAGIAPQ